MKMQVQETLEIGERRRPKCWQQLCPNYLSVLVYLVSMLIVATTVGLLVFNFALCPKEHIVQTLRRPPDNDTAASNLAEGGTKSDQHHSAPDGSPEAPVQVNNRLPRSVVPISYDIRLIPFLDEGNFTFNGEVKIRVKILEDCFNITLHVLNLRIHRQDVVVREINPNSLLNKVIAISRHETIDAEQFYILHFHTTLRKDAEYEIGMKYVGKLNDNLVGFYLSSYQENGTKRYIASTQFQPTDARQAFPCFDEPALKATFNITIGRPAHMSAISNMPKVKGESKEIDYIPGYVWDVFEPSVPMSTYLVAFAVTDFAYLSNANFTVWARKEGINAARHALDIGPKILKFLEQFFDIPYPLPKVDMIALPDFSAGAMENWGLLTFRETAMLYEPQISATGIKQRVATVVAHELAHQWFGNLVTPSWWTDLWLNEGFASYMEYIGVEAIEPDWKPMDQFVIHELHNVFILDALSSSHRISAEVTRPEEINEIFDRISYAKGASIIRMMSHFLTFGVFRRGLTNYLRRMSYDSAEQDDLWQFLTKEAHKSNVLPKSMNVKEIMDTWTLQTGFPVLNITRGKSGSSLQLEQKRFTYAPLPASHEPEPLWWIPITYTTSKSPDFNQTATKLWMKREKTIEIEDTSLAGVEWYIFNIQQTGFYRVQYDEDNWRAIVAHLRDPTRFKQIASANRAQLIDDAMNFARAGMLSYKTAMDMTLYLEHEDDYIPWKSAVNALYFIDTMFMKEGDYHLLQKYLLRLLTPTYIQLGFDEKGDEKNLLNIYKRMDILTTACHLGYKDCIQNCNKQFHIWMNSLKPDTQNTISPNLRNVVYCNAIRYGTEEEWDFAFERYKKSTVSSEQELILSALGCSRELWILNRYLEFTLDEKSGIRKQDLHKVFSAVSNNVIGQPVAFSFIRRHFNRLKEYIGENISNLNQIIKQVVHQMNTAFELDELKRFIEKRYGNATRSLLLQQSIERVQVNIEWMNRNYASIREWLRQEVGEAQ